MSGFVRVDVRIAVLSAFALLSGACSEREGARVLRVAVAGNFAALAREIAGQFEATTGYEVELSVGSTGQLYAQIVQGAPFQVLLAADTERPRRLIASGQGVSGSQFTYATGRLAALTSSRARSAPDVSTALNNWEMIAIANATTAPYGAAGEQVLARLGLDVRRDRIVTATGVAQAFQFVASGAVDGGLVALAQAATLDSTQWVAVPDSLHDPIDQDAVLIKGSETDAAALAWMRFLRSPEVRALIEARGYEVTESD